MKKVLILQKVLPVYRVAFFNKLKNRLSENNIELDLIYGNGSKEELLKKDKVDIPWAKSRNNKIFNIAGKEVYWQPVLNDLPGYDLVIAEQANKLLVNYLLNIKRNFSSQKFAYWGHGKNMQAEGKALGNIYKKFFQNKCDWWFAYTASVKEYLKENGFPEEQVTIVQNAIDATELQNQYNDVTPEELLALKESLNINSNHVGIYCGGMYPEKRLPFLIEACDKIREKVDDFTMIFIGAGIDQEIVKEAAENRDWMHYVGPKRGKEKAVYFRLSDVFLMPGLVGLAVLDAFNTQTPMVTTDYEYHSPEIEYLQHGTNGLITENNLESYVDNVLSIFTNNNLQSTLIEGCTVASELYTIEVMVENFASGIEKALNITPLEKELKKVF
ncbi:glycosyltransferase family 4 protein [Chondrinema litorale]|uniref:glycosyltransferase family 4 protein n=1 Tax=Chondrinema litorale TaxID=2994555 RepID=UPI002543D86A|nr:glycosyltransferase family 4 protein [Chondrinema litorale]UZR92739.1 glycosyltransferase family 4 protein [Chondrinema litorale]